MIVAKVEDNSNTLFLQARGFSITHIIIGLGINDSRVAIDVIRVEGFYRIAARSKFRKRLQTSQSGARHSDVSGYGFPTRSFARNRRR